MRNRFAEIFTQHSNRLYFDNIIFACPVKIQNLISNSHLLLLINLRKAATGSDISITALTAISLGTTKGSKSPYRYCIFRYVLTLFYALFGGKRKTLCLVVPRLSTVTAPPEAHAVRNCNVKTAVNSPRPVKHQLTVCATLLYAHGSRQLTIYSEREQKFNSKCGTIFSSLLYGLSSVWS